MRGFKMVKNQKSVVKACVITCPESRQRTQINKPFYESGEVTLATYKVVPLLLILLTEGPDCNFRS
jgi:hypothetical protein